MFTPRDIICEILSAVQSEMQTNVHGKALATDLWTGESFDVSVKFKIPTDDGWKGCYSTPSTALAALEASFLEMTETPTKEKIHEFRHLFHSSLYQVDPTAKLPEIHVAPD